MKAKTISQLEARRLRTRVEQLEGMIKAERRRWASADYPGGTHIGTFTVERDVSIYSAIYMAQLLQHAVVCVADGHHKFHVYALPHAEMPV